MRNLGWAYLGLVLLDFLVSALAIYGLPKALFISGQITLAAAGCSIYVLIATLRGKLGPLSVFVSLPVYYCVMFAFGIVIGIKTAIDLGAERVGNTELTPQFLTSHFPWYGTAQIVTLAVWFVLLLYGFVAYARSSLLARSEDL